MVLTKEQVIELRKNVTASNKFEYMTKMGVNSVNTIINCVEGKTYAQYNDIAKPRKLKRKKNSNSPTDEMRQFIAGEVEKGTSYEEIRKLVNERFGRKYKTPSAVWLIAKGKR